MNIRAQKRQAGQVPIHPLPIPHADALVVIAVRRPPINDRDGWTERLWPFSPLGKIQNTDSVASEMCLISLLVASEPMIYNRNRHPSNPSTAVI